jgi:hypothetical protein
MGLVVRDDGWRIPDKLWEEMERFLPPGKAHPLGCHNPRVPERDAMNAILFVLRTGCQWAALDGTGLCKHSSAQPPLPRVGASRSLRAVLDLWAALLR